MICSNCKIEKPIEDFWKNKAEKSGRQHQCKICLGTYNKNNPNTTKAKANAWTRDWQKKNPEKTAKNQRVQDLKKYGITPGEYTELFTKQNGVCLICGSPPVGKGKINNRLSVDHCHKTGKIRGLLCEPCNLLLGLAKDRAELLYKAAEYIENSLFSGHSHNISKAGSCGS